MNVARVAFQATGDEAARWSERQVGRPGSREMDERELRAAQRASLEALGIRVEE